MRIGIAHPYDVGTPGGVDVHVQQLATALRARGHHVLTLAPGRSARGPEETVTGPSLGFRFNGSVAHISPLLTTARRARRWVRDNDLDVLHVHEPATPSASAFALRAARSAGVPVVATFHAAIDDLARLDPAARLLRRHLRGIAVRIAVSAEAARTQREWLGAECEIVPNGIDLSSLRPAAAGTAAASTGGGRASNGSPANGSPANGSPHATGPSIVFLGRADEPRKGMGVLAAAWPAVLAAHPTARLSVAGPGEAVALELLVAGSADPATAGANAVVLGRVSEEHKIKLLQSADVFVAPHTGGESFGIVLVEAMAAGAPVVASDLTAFTDILGTDDPLGLVARRGDAADLAARIVEALSNTAAARERAARAARSVERFDWGVVAAQVEAAYLRATDGHRSTPPPASSPRDGTGRVDPRQRTAGRDDTGTEGPSSCR